jgi:hypothetical protein
VLYQLSYARKEVVGLKILDVSLTTDHPPPTVSS